MFVWKTWTTIKYDHLNRQRRKNYRVLLLFGVIPLYISIDG